MYVGGGFTPPIDDWKYALIYGQKIPVITRTVKQAAADHKTTFDVFSFPILKF